MTITVRRGGRELAAELVEVLDEWVGLAPLTAQLHSGDLGWHLRMPDDVVDGAFVVCERDGRVAAVGLGEDQLLRLAVDPRQDRDAEVAEVVADVAAEFRDVEVAGGTTARRRLQERGWAVDPHPWVLLHRELTDDDARLDDPAVRQLGGSADVEARAAVQRSAFAPGSTFTPERWASMAAGPTFDARFDLVAWTPDGQAAAAATGWWAGPGRYAAFEPVGTHADHRRQGYGRRVTLGVMAALARAGATGIRVHTPVSNAGGVAAYEAIGMRQVEWTTDLRRPAG